MKSHYETLIAANEKYVDLLAQQLRASGRVETLSRDSAPLLRKLSDAATETRKVIELELRGVATEADIAAAKDIEVELRDQYAAMQQQIEVARTTGANMVGEMQNARTQAIKAREDVCMEVAGTLTKAICNDVKLRAKLLEIYAAMANCSVSGGEESNGMHVDARWGAMLATVFASPEGGEHVAAVADFRVKYQLPVLGKAVAHKSA